MRTLLAGIVLALLLTCGGIAHAQHVWDHMGANPYGGTPEFALEHSGWPVEVQQGLLWYVHRGPGAEVVIDMYNGRRFDFVSFGGTLPGTRPTVYRNMVARLPADQRSQPAEQWWLQWGGVTYYLLRFHVCHNFAGLHEEALRTELPPVDDCERCC